MSKYLNWSADVGMDELDENMFRIQITDESGNDVCHAFGRTTEECMSRGKLIARAVNGYAGLIKFVEETARMYEDVQPV